MEQQRSCLEGCWRIKGHQGPYTYTYAFRTLLHIGAKHFAAGCRALHCLAEPLGGGRAGGRLLHIGDTMSHAGRVLLSMGIPGPYTLGYPRLPGAGHCVIVQSRWEEAVQAAALLAKGPEPLRSRFGVGFGTALNLLATRSLDDARAFVQRSFANYLGARREVTSCAES